MALIKEHWIKILFVGLLAVVLYMSIGTLADYFNGGPSGIFGDAGDWGHYFSKETNWFEDGLVPYRDTNQGYPQLATLFLSWPRFFSNNFNIYKSSLLASSIILFVILILTSYSILEKLKKNVNYILLLFLPSVVFFTFFRFDILPALLVQLSFYLIFKKKYGWSMFVLALATMTKWYPALIFFPFTLYFWNLYRNRQLNKNNFIVLIISFFAPIFAIFFLTFIIGGSRAVLEPYLMHAQRLFENGSLPAVLVNIFSLPTHNKIIYLVFVFLQLSGLLLLFLKRPKIRNNKTLILWSVFIIMIFIIFSRVYSNQYILWFFPLLILAVDSVREIILLIVYDLLNYLQFPLLWGLYKIKPFVANLDFTQWGFASVVILRSLILLIFIFFIWKKIKKQEVETSNQIL